MRVKRRRASPGRRGRGEGSVYWNEKLGRWQASVPPYRDPRSGRVLRPTKTARTREEVADWLTQALATRDRQLRQGADRLCGEYFDEWLEEAVRPTSSPGTFDRRQRDLELVRPELENLTLAQLTPEHCRRALNRARGKRGGELSAWAKRSIHASMGAALRPLVPWCLPYCPMDGVKAPPEPKSRARALRPSEAHRMLEAAGDEVLGAIYPVAIGLGLRRGELLALSWDAVDFALGQLHVRRAYAEVRGKLILGLPKGRKCRTVRMPAAVAAALKAHRAQQAQQRLQDGLPLRADDLVFATRLGGPIFPSTFYRSLARVRTAAKVEHLRIHDMRHTAATFLAVKGVPMKAQMEVLGHSRPIQTLDYTHVEDELRQQSADAMDEMLTPLPEKRPEKRSS